MRNSAGNAILSGIVAVTLLAVSAVMLTKGYLSSLKLKSRVQIKASFSSVEDGIVYAFTDRNLYLTNSAINQALETKITIPQAGNLTRFNPVSAAKLENQTILSQARARCSQDGYSPSQNSSPAEFIFCFSTDNPLNSNAAPKSPHTFFGVDAAFGLMKVTMKNRNDSHLNSIIRKANWGEFKQNPDNFRAEFNYQIFWGREKQPAFSKLGYTIRDLR